MLIESAIVCLGELERVGAGAGCASCDGVPLVSGGQARSPRGPSDPGRRRAGADLARSGGCVLPGVVGRPERRPGATGWAGGDRGDRTGPVGGLGRDRDRLRDERHRRKRTRVLSDPAVTVLVVEHRDRLTRFGFEHLSGSLAACSRRVVVLDDAETADDLVRDVTEVLTSLCARRYGRRSASRRAAKAVAVATGSDQP